MDLPQPLREGRFIRRLNRFAVDVRIGRAITRAHVPNSGRLGELLVEGAQLYLHPVAGRDRVTTHDLVLARHGSVLVSLDSRAPAAIAAEAFVTGAVDPLPPAEQVRREVPFGDGRLDLCVRASGEEWLVEVKGCTLVRDGTAIFPEAPTRRGRRHVEELAAFAEKGGRAMVLFVVQRVDARAFRPNVRTDPGFAEALQRAAGSGVLLRAYTCRVTTRQIALDRRLPVSLGEADHPCA